MCICESVACCDGRCRISNKQLIASYFKTSNPKHILTVPFSLAFFCIIVHSQIQGIIAIILLVFTGVSLAKGQSKWNDSAMALCVTSMGKLRGTTQQNIG